MKKDEEKVIAALDGTGNVLYSAVDYESTSCLCVNVTHIKGHRSNGLCVKRVSAEFILLSGLLRFKRLLLI